MSYYENEKEYSARGIDPDLAYCLEYNPQSFEIAQIKAVLGVVEGERDEANWHWIMQLLGGKFVYLTGWCDYTGWDCQSGANAAEFETLGAALMAVPEVDEGYSRKGRKLREPLVEQVAGEKFKTWRETKDAELADLLAALPGLPK